MSAATTFPPWSFSSLELFEQCPEKWNRKYHTRDYKEPPMEHRVHGQTIHKILEDRLKRYTPMPPHMAKFEPMMAMLNNFGAENMLIEHKIGLNIRLQPTDFWAKDVWARGVVDLGLIRENLGIVADYKSGKRRVKFDQTEIFSHMLFAHLPKVDTLKNVFIWTRFGDGGEKSPEKLYDSKIVTRDQSPIFWQKTLPRIERMRYAFDHNDYFEKPSPLCGWCWVKSCKHCPNR